MAYFTAGFAKWRFETISEVLRQLGLLRAVCEKSGVDRNLFGNVQDEADLNQFVVACQDVKLWRFIVVFYQFCIKYEEGLRRWGLLCPCCKEDRRLKKAKKHKGKETQKANK